MEPLSIIPGLQVYNEWALVSPGFRDSFQRLYVCVQVICGINPAAGTVYVCVQVLMFERYPGYPRWLHVRCLFKLGLEARVTEIHDPHLCFLDDDVLSFRRGIERRKRIFNRTIMIQC